MTSSNKHCDGTLLHEMRPILTCLVLLLLFPIPFLRAGELRISGHAPGAENRELRLYRYDDYVSLRKIRMGSTRIQADGYFNLVCQLDQTDRVMFFIDFHQAEMLAEPDQHYQIRVEGFEKPGYQEALNPFVTPVYLDLIPEGNSQPVLTVFYDTLNAWTDRFMITHAEDLLNRKYKLNTDSLKAHWTGVPGSQHPFALVATEYRIAQLIPLYSSRLRLRVFEDYLEQRAVLPEHPDYMAFFTQYFDKWVLTSRQLPFYLLAGSLQGSNPYAAVMDFLGRDSLLRSAVIRELALLVNIRDMYYHPELRKESILLLLTQIEERSSMPANRKIAHNLRQVLQYLEPGTPAPPLTLKSISGEVTGLERYRGKYLYIQFFTTLCTPCVAELKLTENLEKEFGEQFAFLAISADLEPARLPPFLKRYPFPGDVAHFGHDFDMLEAYNIRSYPSFVLIDREGRIMAAPARRPSEEAAVIFSRILAPLRRP